MADAKNSTKGAASAAKDAEAAKELAAAKGAAAAKDAEDAKTEAVKDAAAANAAAAEKGKDDAKGEATTDKVEASDGEGEATVKKDIVPSKYRDQYAANKGNCGDFIASELSAVMEKNGIESLDQIKADNGIAKVKWHGLNNGQQRMNLSNALRAAYLRGDTINILGKEFSLEGHMEEFGGKDNFDGSDPKQVAKFLGFVDMPENTRNTRAIKKFFHDDPKKALERAKREEEREAAKKAKAEKAEADKKAKAEKAEADKKAKAKAEADAKNTGSKESGKSDGAKK